MTTTKRTRVEIPQGATSKEVLALVANGDVTKAAATKFIKARMDRAVENGRLPRYAARKAYAELTGKEYEFDRAALVGKPKPKPKPATKPAAKPAAKPANKPATKPQEPSVDDLIAMLADKAGIDASTLAAMFTMLAK